MATWLLRLSSSRGFLQRSRRLPHPVASDLRQVRPLRPLRLGGSLVRLCSRARRLGLSLEPVRDLSPGPPSVRALQRLRAWRPQRPPRSVRRRRPASLAPRPRDPSALASRLPVRPMSKAERPVRRSPLLPDRNRACPPDRPLLPRGCRGRRCNLQLRVHSQHRARRRTQ